MSEDTTEVEGMGNILKEFDKRQADAEKAFGIFSQNVYECTGKKPNEACNALDVMRLMYKFYGEPKND